jgi:hypothetical protein
LSIEDSAAAATFYLRTLHGHRRRVAQSPEFQIA